MYTETTKQATKDGVNFVKYLANRGIVTGIKVDQGLKPLPGTNDETATMGLDTLDAFAKEHYALGCRFAKWRAVLKIGNGCPSD